VTSFVLVPGAGGQAWYWHRVVPLLEERGHTAVPVELPATDDTAGLAEYADTIVAASPQGEVVVVAHSMGGLSAPLVVDRLDVREFVLVNAMTPGPGETGGEWWDAVGQEQAAREFAHAQGRDPDAPFDVWDVFFHDVPPEITAAAKAMPEPVQSDRPFADPFPLAAWPDVPTRFLASRDDRLFPLKLQRRIVRERLGIEVEEIPGGHLVALSEPVALVERLLDRAG
jgi:Predicted acetyltransferases and hydrolases with the alpha/beta hydrolase fold